MTVCIVQLLEIVEVYAHNVGDVAVIVFFDVRNERVTVEYAGERVEAEMFYVQIQVVERDVKRYHTCKYSPEREEKFREKSRYRETAAKYEYSHFIGSPPAFAEIAERKQKQHIYRGKYMRLIRERAASDSTVLAVIEEQISEQARQHYDNIHKGGKICV